LKPVLKVPDITLTLQHDQLLSMIAFNSTCAPPNWSVNFKFVPEHVFLSKPFALGLLAAHLAMLLALAHRRWHKHGGGFCPRFVLDFFER
jgi:hypothetical protein